MVFVSVPRGAVLRCPRPERRSSPSGSWRGVWWGKNRKKWWKNVKMLMNFRRFSCFRWFSYFRRFSYFRWFSYSMIRICRELDNRDVSDDVTGKIQPKLSEKWWEWFAGRWLETMYDSAWLIIIVRIWWEIHKFMGFSMPQIYWVIIFSMLLGVCSIFTHTHL